MQSKNYLQQVREQYENYPYPFRDPEDEKKQLHRCCNDSFDLINFYCFGGRRNLYENCRFLVAGGGTGDSAIFLAEQLRGTSSEVVYLDMSESSMDIAKKRAEIRGLENIQWVHASLLDLPKLGLGEFDMINCCGVLHHLENPDEGLAALNAVLKEDGALSIMVYGQHGRASVYQMQTLMRLFNDTVPNMQERVDIAKGLVHDMPDGHIIKRQDPLFMREVEKSDIGVYDLYLHSQDRAYTVPQLYEFLQKQNLNLIEFIEMPGAKFLYDPTTYIADEKLHARLQEIPHEKQQALAELLCGNLSKHAFYASRKPAPLPSIEDEEMVPSILGENAGLEKLAKQMKQSMGGHVMLKLPFAEFPVQSTPGWAALCSAIDGQRTVAEIIEKAHEEAKGSITKPVLRKELTALYERLNSVDWVLLRHKDVPPVKSYKALQDHITQKYAQQEKQSLVLGNLLRQSY